MVVILGGALGVVDGVLQDAPGGPGLGRELPVAPGRVVIQPAGGKKEVWRGLLMAARSSGLLGTLLLDVAAILQSVYPQW